MDVQKKDTAKCVKELFDRLERRLGKELLNRNATLKTVAFTIFTKCCTYLENLAKF